MKFQIMAGASAAALLFAGTAFAQQGSQASYTPAVTQSSAADASSIDQIGNDNSALVNQNDAGATGDSSVVIQGGSGFAASSQNNAATVTQSGSGQRSLVMQATTTSTNGTSGNAPSNTAGNAALVNQSGSDQSAFTYQFGSNNASKIQQSQTGTSQLASNANPQGVNGAAGTQTGINDAVALRRTTVQQIDSDIFQGIGGNQVAALADVVQDWATNNKASITQSGSQERAVAVQAFQTASTAVVNETGVDNDAWISQQGVTGTGSNDYASISDSSVAGLASVVQADAMNSFSTVSQSGTQPAAYSYQSGMNEYSTISQSDAFSTASVNQTGNNDVSDVTQGGGAGFNSASVNQGLANAWSHVAQNGYDNSATVNQGTPAAFLTPKY